MQSISDSLESILAGIMRLEMKMDSLKLQLNEKIDADQLNSIADHLSTKIQSKFTESEVKLSEISKNLGIKSNSTLTRDEILEDRKRIKERLKSGCGDIFDAQDDSYDLSTSWLEYLFGICPPDHRSGKEGSRSQPQPTASYKF